MARVYYIGDEATAAGYRLAGAEVRVPTTENATETLRQAFSERPDCVLFDGTLVDYVPAAELEHALIALSPLFAVIPDVRGKGAPPNLARTVRNALGID